MKTMNKCRDGCVLTDAKISASQEEVNGSTNVSSRALRHVLKVASQDTSVSRP